ncbi:MAG: M20/M25/M40 family metallo-hydrolase [Eubacteriales bacterium]
MNYSIDTKALLDRFLAYVQIDSETGDEAAMTERLIKDFTELGCTVTTDDVKEAAKTNGANVYAVLEGDPSLPAVLFSSHMDTVTPGKGIKPQVDPDGYVRSDGTTVLGGDDKAGICAIMEAVKALKLVEKRPTVEVVITVREEGGLHGSKNLDYSRLNSKFAVILDSSGGPDKVITAAPGQSKIIATVIGKAAHAGIAPEEGISAIAVASHAVSQMNLLRIDEETTCNIGTFTAIGATNIVAPKAELVLECRSRNTDKLMKQTEHLVGCLKDACEKFGATLEHTVDTSYLAYSHAEDSHLVKSVFEAARASGLTPKAAASGGGSDANIFNQNGITAVNLGVGMEKVHTTSEQQNIEQMNQGAELCYQLVKAWK